MLWKVDMRKVNLQVIRPWIAKKVIELLGFDDEVVVEYAMGLLEDTSKPVRFDSDSLTPRPDPLMSDARPKENADQSDRFLD